MNKNGVKKLYALFGAKWYDFFKNIWNKIVAFSAEKELAKFFRANIKEDKSILELGCGTALNLKKIFTLNLNFRSYLGTDFSPDMLKIAKNKFAETSKVKFRQQDITDLSNIESKFDLIICTWVLSHLEIGSRSEVINNAQKLLAHNGKMFLIFFTKPKWYINFWLFPFAKYLFQITYVSNEEIQKFKSVKTKHSFSANMATTVEIS